MLRTLVLSNRRLLAVFICGALLTGPLIQVTNRDGRLDYWLHDAALVYRARTTWPHTAIVALDDDVPIAVSRRQALPLYALAINRMAEVGVLGIFMDARLPKELDGNMPYARCIEQNGIVRWAMPRCVATPPLCELHSSLEDHAPLAISEAAVDKFLVAPYLPGQDQLPDFLLYGWDAALLIPESGLVASDRLIAPNNSPVARWMDLSEDHAVVRLARMSDEKVVQAALHDDSADLRCNDDRPCRPIRFSVPTFRLQTSGERLILPVSRLAACNADIAQPEMEKLRDKLVILQLTTPSESTDIITTPMMTAWQGPQRFTPGPQYLADAVETLLQRDHPRPPSPMLQGLLFCFTAITTVLTGAYLTPLFLWLWAALLLLILLGLCFLNPLVQFWPVTATFAVYVTATLETIAAHLMIGFRESKLISQYMPRQIHNLLLSTKKDQRFTNRRCHIIALMSDVAGYTTVTGLLKEPVHVLNLMNDYLEETSFVLQDKYNGWLEAYVGDMVCYYWPFVPGHAEADYRNALLAVVELARLQKRFFSSLSERYKHRFDDAALAQISQIINAGIGMTSGRVVMGDLGPSRGVRKFGVLGDPLNLAARIESLTRHFSTNIIVTGDFVDSAQHCNLVVRRLGRISVKGRDEPETLYALGEASDPRFERSAVQDWEAWVTCIEQRLPDIPSCPTVYAKDQATLRKWLERGFLRTDGVWHLEEK